MQGLRQSKRAVIRLAEPPAPVADALAALVSDVCAVLSTYHEQLNRCNQGQTNGRPDVSC